MVNERLRICCNVALIAALIKRRRSRGDANVQRKVFRVEQMFGYQRAQAPIADTDTPHDNRAELALIHETIARTRHELLTLRGSSAEPRMVRAMFELGAAVDEMEKATKKILQFSEAIDESAKTLAATLKTDYQRGLTLDIQEQVLHIFESCTFQDISGQRIGKAIAALQAVEDHVTRMLDQCERASPGADAPSAAARPDMGGLINGPKLEGDDGHASQRDIDAIFS